MLLLYFSFAPFVPWSVVRSLLPRGPISACQRFRLSPLNFPLSTLPLSAQHCAAFRHGRHNCTVISWLPGVPSGVPGSRYLYDLTTGKILEQPEEIVAFIHSTPETPRRVSMAQPDLQTVRLKVEKHIKNTYLKQVQAPVGVKPELQCRMELN